MYAVSPLNTVLNCYVFYIYVTEIRTQNDNIYIHIYRPNIYCRFVINKKLRTDLRSGMSRSVTIGWRCRRHTSHCTHFNTSSFINFLQQKMLRIFGTVITLETLHTLQGEETTHMNSRTISWSWHSFVNQSLYNFIWCMVFILYYYELIYNQCPYNIFSYMYIHVFVVCTLIKINKAINNLRSRLCEWQLIVSSVVTVTLFLHRQCVTHLRCTSDAFRQNTWTRLSASICTASCPARRSPAVGRTARTSSSTQPTAKQKGTFSEDIILIQQRNVCASL